MSELVIRYTTNGTLVATNLKGCANYLNTDAELVRASDYDDLKELVSRFERIEAAATQVAFEIRESKKIGQYIGQEWIAQKLEEALKPCKKK